MTLGEKIKDIRKRLGFSQEDLAKIINVSRQAITKWERDDGVPDISNLKELSKIFKVSIDYLLDNNSHLPNIIIEKELDKTKYKNKLSSYEEILKEYFNEEYEIYVLTREKNMNFIERVMDIFVGGIAPEMIYPIETSDVLSDLSPYYLVKKDNIKLLVNIKKWNLIVIELPSETNDKKFIYNKNKFRNCGKIKLKRGTL